MSGIGKDQVRLFRKSQDKQVREVFHIGIQTRLQMIEPDMQIYTKILHISPLRIIVNNMSGELTLNQRSNALYEQIVQPFSRVPFGVCDNSQPTEFMLQYRNKKGQVYFHMGYIDLAKEVHFSLVLRNMKDERDNIFVKVELIEDHHQIFVVFTQTRMDDASYLIQNNLENFELIVYQDQFERLLPNSGLVPRHHIKPHQAVQFGWDIQDKDMKDILIVFSDLRNPSQQFMLQRANLEHEYSRKRKSLAVVQDEKFLYHDYYLDSKLMKNTHVLTFSEAAQKQAKDVDEE
jgi:SHR-binding domain of vacuolar-sorting associated protein 13